MGNKTGHLSRNEWEKWKRRGLHATGATTTTLENAVPQCGQSHSARDDGDGAGGGDGADLRL